jgi:hypothetical protein
VFSEIIKYCLSIENEKKTIKHRGVVETFSAKERYLHQLGEIFVSPMLHNLSQKMLTMFHPFLCLFHRRLFYLFPTTKSSVIHTIAVCPCLSIMLTLPMPKGREFQFKPIVGFLHH